MTAGHDLGVAADGYICQNEPEHPDDQPEIEMVSPGPSLGRICPECGRMAGGPDDHIAYSDPPHDEDGHPDLEELRERHPELVLYGTDDPESYGCVNVWPFWDQDLPVPGDHIALSDGDWVVQYRRFSIGDRTVEVYADPPEGARG